VAFLGRFTYNARGFETGGNICSNPAAENRILAVPVSAVNQV
jgi:hypothetical protein